MALRLGGAAPQPTALAVAGPSSSVPGSDTAPHSFHPGYRTEKEAGTEICASPYETGTHPAGVADVTTVGKG